MNKKLKRIFEVKLNDRQAVQFVEKAMLMGLTANDLMQAFVTQVIETGIGNNSTLGKWMEENKIHTESTDFLRHLYFKGLLSESFVKLEVITNMTNAREISSRDGKKEIDLVVKKLTNELLSLYKEYAGDRPEAISFNEAMDALNAYKKQLRFFKVKKESTEQSVKGE